jgi:DNA polymerase III epsilon subunit-like protein
MLNKILWIDLETDGLYHENEVIQMAGCIEKEDGSISNIFDIKVKPYDFSNITPEALKINGITREELETYDDGETAMKKLLEIISPYAGDYHNRLMIGGYNNIFDVFMLRNFFARVYNPRHDLSGDYHIYYKEYYKYFQHKSIDVFSLIPFIENKIGKVFLDSSLKNVFEFFFPDEKLNWHDAKNDIYATVKLYKAFRKGLKI